MTIGCPQCLAPVEAERAEEKSKNVVCISCGSQFKVPETHILEKLQQQTGLPWAIRSARDGTVRRFERMKEIEREMEVGSLSATDQCATFDFAPGAPLRQVMDKNYEFRRLYDPAYAISNRLGKFAGLALMVIAFVIDLINNGWGYPIALVLGSVAIGLAIFSFPLFALLLVLVVFILKSSLLAYILTVVLAALGALLAYMIGYWTTRIITNLFIRLSGIQSRAQERFSQFLHHIE